jgi:hypothetical protein
MTCEDQDRSFFTLYDKDYFTPSSPSYINLNLPINQAPSPLLPAYATCNTLNPPDGTVAYSTSCVTPPVYDLHTTYDPVTQRFVIAGHVRNPNYQYPMTPQAGQPPVPSPGADVNQYSWRYTLLAVSVSENPSDGFYTYQLPQYYSDWPRVGVSGNYLVVAYHGSSSSNPLVTLYPMSELAQNVTNPDSYTYSDVDLVVSHSYTADDYTYQRVGFLVVPAHDEPLDTGTNTHIAGTAYVTSKSADGEATGVWGFVPNGTGKPNVIYTWIGAGAGVDPTAATIRNGFFYLIHEDKSNSFAHLDQFRITTAVNASNPGLRLTLQPTWSADFGLPGYQLTAPSVEAAGDLRSSHFFVSPRSSRP